MSKGPPPEEHGEKVPVWIISFADMITLLMSFFVMLQTMASTQDNTLFGASRDSFRRVISGFGIPDLLFGKETGPKFDYRKVRYPTEEASQTVPPNRVIDADDQKICQLFNEIARQDDVKTADTTEIVVQAASADVSFPAGSAAVDAAGRDRLAAFAGNLRRDRQPETTRLYVVGLVAGTQAGKDQCVLAARRAGSVEACLRASLAAADGTCRWETFSWGGPAGKGAMRICGVAADKTGVLIMVMGVKSNGG